MAGPLVSREAIELIFRLCEQQPAEISWQVLNTHFDRLGGELISTGALVETTPSETIVMPMISMMSWSGSGGTRIVRRSSGSIRTWD